VIVLDLPGDEHAHRHDDQQHEDLLHGSFSGLGLSQAYIPAPATSLKDM
jgi:hypothetical protein